MGKRGPKKKTRDQLRITGNPGRRKLPPAAAADVTDQAAPPDVAGVPEPPIVLTEAALAEWRRVVPLLQATGRLTKLDRGPLAAYCQTWADWEAERVKIQATGVVLMIRDDKGNLKSATISPHVNAAMKFLEKLRQFASDFGMTSASRGGGLSALQPTEKPTSKLALFLGKRNA